jgi:hypothetical protein
MFADSTPDIVRPLLQAIYTDPAFSGARHDVLNRLLTDPRMARVYRELLRFDRETRSYYHAARNPKPDQSSKDAQLEAIRDLLELAVAAATDRIAVTTFEEVVEEKQFRLDQARWLRELARDMKRPAVLGALAVEGSSSIAEALEDLQTLNRVADRLERFTAVMRSPNDLLVVDKHRGDPIVRGVHILISKRIDKLFGKRLDGTAATLTGAALGAETSPRASRSALSARKLRKRRDSL